MAEKFYSILTNIGKAKVANSIGLGTKINFAKMKIGDGGGAYYEPTEGQTDLKNVVWEGNINHVTVDEKNPNWIHIEVMIPSTVGGFTIREYGAFDDENNLIGICKCAETYKPVIADGSTKELLLDLILCVVNTDTVELKVDPTIIFAKKGEVEQLRTDITAQLKDIANNKASKTELEDLKNTVANIDLSASKVNLATINGMSAKNVQAGMQELFTFASNGKNAIAGKVGNVTGSNTHAEIANRIQTDKNTTASNLNSKGVSASGNEALASLVSKIANISIQGMGGKNFLEGVINHTNGTRDEIFLNFNAGSITVDQPNSSYSQYPYVCITKVGGSFYPFQSSNSVSGIYYDSTKKILSISSSVSTGNFPFNAWGE
ncbi:phage tail-collar fiber family protein [Clostridium botulinum 202F]|nr:phage tail-collar fiber family protein [Clostridium botulinum 202F]